MNLTSCDNCGVVLDKDKLNFPEDIYDAENCIDFAKAVWVEMWYAPFIPCPVCGEKILGDERV